MSTIQTRNQQTDGDQYVVLDMLYLTPTLTLNIDAAKPQPPIPNLTDDSSSQFVSQSRPRGMRAYLSEPEEGQIVSYDLRQNMDDRRQGSR